MGRLKTIEDDELLAAARRVFREQGHAASTRDVARAAGISQAVLYQRFGSKEDLFFRAMTPDLPALDSLLGPYPPEDVLEDLIAIAERLSRFFGAFMPTFLKVVSHPLADAERLREWHGQLPFAPVTHALKARIERLQADGLVSDVRAEATAFALVSLAHAVAMFELFASDGERREREPSVRHSVEVLWKGLEPHASSAGRSTSKRR